uniref:UbiA prenyltransferase n=1 Tax=Sexangularia sp. CB-2014 TaxID=1486929 RepID=A0A7S1V268_9EUKA|mmetsp:Transcript_10258/g.32543  ORF Transcript_10258/g.32543 Transcript_10258/m.32543 type:complete len:367 (+) Transcript_10258:105-1205(+)
MQFSLLFRLLRPKFLPYSFICHVLGAVYAHTVQASTISHHTTPWQSYPSSLPGDIGWTSSLPAPLPTLFAVLPPPSIVGQVGLLQLTLSTLHLAVHALNEVCDRDADRANANAGKWTGGSGVLRDNLLPVSLVLAVLALLLSASLWGGVAIVLAIMPQPHGSSLWQAIVAAATTGPSAHFIAVGLSTIVVGITYSLPPVRLSARGAGELAVAYVLAFAAPACGLTAQGGRIDAAFVQAFAPLALINAARMYIMNVPDRAGDEAVGKRTSVVEMGSETTATWLSVGLWTAHFAIAVPTIPMPPAMRLGYAVYLPVRLWSIYPLLRPQWWATPETRDQVTRRESFTVAGAAACLLAVMCLHQYHASLQ